MRIQSILHAKSLDTSVTSFPSFNLAALQIDGEMNCELPTNLRLGHLAEKVVSYLISISSNYAILHENIQILDGKQTIGELDYILEETATKQIIHMELAYKFYLYDPNLSANHAENWIGPNRNDSLVKKLHKLKTKQFPLLNHPCTKHTLKALDITQITQALCLLVSLYVPYEHTNIFSPVYQQAIRGYYIDYKTFITLNVSDKSYYLPPRKEWGVAPDKNTTWRSYNEIQDHIKLSMQEKQAPLCWQKQGDKYTEFFIVWW